MSSRNSVHDFIMLLPALLLVGWLVLVIILMFRDDKCDKTYREGSFPEFICLHSDRSSLRETDSERLIVKYTEIKSQKIGKTNNTIAKKIVTFLYHPVSLCFFHGYCHIYVCCAVLLLFS